MKSWKTTLGGLLVALGQGLPQVLPAEWQWVGSMLTGIGGLLLGVAARDHGATPEPAVVK